MKTEISSFSFAALSAQMIGMLDCAYAATLPHGALASQLRALAYELQPSLSELECYRVAQAVAENLKSYAAEEVLQEAA